MGDPLLRSQSLNYKPITLAGSWRGVVTATGPGSVDIDDWKSWIETLVQNKRHLPKVQILKTSATAEVLEAAGPGDSSTALRVVCKRQKAAGFLGSVFSLLRVSEAGRNFSRAVRLHEAGVGTALPLCRMERKWPRESWLVSEYVANLIDLDAFVLSSLPRLTARQHRNRRAMTEALADVFHRLRSAGLYHRDMKASNLMLEGFAAEPRFVIVDVEGLELLMPWRSQWKPIVRLAASLLSYPAVSRTDFARFLRGYLKKSGQDTTSWRALFGQLLTQASKYARESQQRKSGKLDRYSGDAVSGIS